MYQIEWFDTAHTPSSICLAIPEFAIKKEVILSKLLLKWEEHCVECAYPECYSNCSLYRPRKDGACARFEYGIFPNINYNGNFHFAADIQFKKWGKIEACLNGSFPTQLLSHDDESKYQFGAELHKSVNPGNFNIETEFDLFLIECYSAETPFNIILEYFTQTNGLRLTKFRSSIEIKYGYNVYSIPIKCFNLTNPEGYIYLYPEAHEPEKRIIFTWLDFVKVLPDYNLLPQQSGSDLKPVKCVAWDLDNTIWEGILSEDTNIKLRPHILEVVYLLDSIGILQTIVSKNNSDLAIAKLKEFNIYQYFLNPQINWDPKSTNLLRISSSLNIPLDAFAFVDDTEFERFEVKNQYPQVRLYNDLDQNYVTTSSEFRGPKSNFSKERREVYKVELKRQENIQNFAGDYDGFLKSCEMIISIFKPLLEEDRRRCWELIQRSNQLNLSNKRHTWEAFQALLESEALLNITISAKDKFGDYGIIGFMSIDITTSNAIVMDFVLSCRAAQKKIEHVVITTIGNLLLKRNFVTMSAHFFPTVKNYPIAKVFYDLGFTISATDNNYYLFSKLLSTLSLLPNIMKICLLQPLLGLSENPK